jgi:hypothetical protein
MRSNPEQDDEVRSLLRFTLPKLLRYHLRGKRTHATLNLRFKIQTGDIAAST